MLFPYDTDAEFATKGKGSGEGDGLRMCPYRLANDVRGSASQARGGKGDLPADRQEARGRDHCGGVDG